ncbi:hypothetical protein [Halosolutus gelatinilyticus]|uniref:hypothetical protein n=1 Tax=Halosolutus gelatinilyticus TaxID=2931975 RepID=UPI001FF126E3|nr:hypothetical protein [Halosolutus gelatinilyticus]
MRLSLGDGPDDRRLSGRPGIEAVVDDLEVAGPAVLYRSMVQSVPMVELDVYVRCIVFVPVVMCLVWVVRIVEINEIAAIYAPFGPDDGVAAVGSNIRVRIAAAGR